MITHSIRLILYIDFHSDAARIGVTNAIIAGINILKVRRNVQPGFDFNVVEHFHTVSMNARRT
jgi:hypothetical protein